MLEKLSITCVLASGVAMIYAMSMLATPHRGIMKVVERTAAGVGVCFLCYVLLYPLGVKISQTPFAALCAGYLGLPGVAFSTFVSLWP